MRNIIFMFMWLMLVLFLYPSNISALEITDIDLTGFNEPVLGQTPKFSAGVSEDANYYVYLESWMGNDSTMIESVYNDSIKDVISTFKKDVVYTYSVYVKPKDGNSFSDNVTAQIDGIALNNYRLAGNTIIFEYEYGVPSDADVKVLNVTMPNAGDEPIYTGTVPEGVNYMIHDEVWYDSLGNVVTGQFENGKVYTYRCVIVPLNNFDFKMPIYATVNGDFMTYESNEGNMYVFSYKFKVSKKSYLVVFDANGGVFGKNEDKISVDNWQIGDENKISIPVREDYKFMGYFTERFGGTSLANYIAEAGIDQDMTFYAQWEKVENVDDVVNPDTGDNIMLFMGIGIVSLMGIVGLFVYFVRSKKKESF